MQIDFCLDMRCYTLQRNLQRHLHSSLIWGSCLRWSKLSNRCRSVQRNVCQIARACVACCRKPD
jgi:hypothetical protein